jgi:predicted membrane channel-forming protein YqfA (hemolysin III family)
MMTFDFVYRNTQTYLNRMWMVALAWSYVVVMMAVAEALAPNGTVLGAVFTLLLYGVLPLGIVLYVMATPARRAARRRAAASAQPDGGGHPAGDTVTTKREKA